MNLILVYLIGCLVTSVYCVSVITREWYERKDELRNEEELMAIKLFCFVCTIIFILLWPLTWINEMRIKILKHVKKDES